MILIKVLCLLKINIKMIRILFKIVEINNYLILIKNENNKFYSKIIMIIMIFLIKTKII